MHTLSLFFLLRKKKDTTKLAGVGSLHGLTLSSVPACDWFVLLPCRRCCSRTAGGRSDSSSSCSFPVPSMIYSIHLSLGTARMTQGKRFCCVSLAQYMRPPAAQYIAPGFLTILPQARSLPACLQRAVPVWLMPGGGSRDAVGGHPGGNPPAMAMHDSSSSARPL